MTSAVSHDAARRPAPAERRAGVRRASWLRRVSTVVLWCVVAVGGGAFAVSLAVPLWFQLHDERLLIVTSGSMTPTFVAGDAVVMKRVTGASELKVGQIASFVPPGGRHLVTHRIVEVHTLPAMRTDPTTGKAVEQTDPKTGAVRTNDYILTKGDANPADDPDATPVGSVRGIVLGVHHGWGWVLQWAGSPAGRATMLVPPLLALATLEVMSLTGSRRRGDRRTPDEPGRSIDDLLLS